MLFIHDRDYCFPGIRTTPLENAEVIWYGSLTHKPIFALVKEVNENLTVMLLSLSSLCLIIYSLKNFLLFLWVNSAQNCDTTSQWAVIASFHCSQPAPVSGHAFGAHSLYKNQTPTGGPGHEGGHVTEGVRPPLTLSHLQQNGQRWASNSPHSPQLFPEGPNY